MKQSADSLPERAESGRPSELRLRRGALSASTSVASSPRPTPDYRRWSIEELRALARQLQVPDASTKSRSELIRLFDISAA